MAESILNIHSLVLPFLASVLRGLVIRLQKGQNRCYVGCTQEPQESWEDDDLKRQNSIRMSEESELPKCRYKQGNWNLARQTSSLSLPFILWSLPCSLLGAANPTPFLSLPTPLSCFVFSRFCHIRHLVLTLLSAHKNKTLQGLCTCWISLRPQPSSLSSVPQSIHLILGIRILWLTNAETSGKEIVKSVACQIWGVLR